MPQCTQAGTVESSTPWSTGLIMNRVVRRLMRTSCAMHGNRNRFHMDRHTLRMTSPGLNDFLAVPRTIRNFTLADGHGAIALLEGVIESVVAQRLPLTPIVLSGPIGCGKRTLATAIARDLAGPVVALEPTTLSGDAHAHAVLRGLPDGATLVLHNIHRFPGHAQHILMHAIRFRALRRPPREMDDPDLADRLRALSAFHTVATTTLRSADVLGRYPDFLCFALARCHQGTAMSIMRALAANGLICDGDAADILASFVCDAPNVDLFGALVKLVVSHAYQVGTRQVDADTARTVSAHAWHFRPVGEAIETLRRRARELGCTPAEAAEKLGAAAAVSAQLDTWTPEIRTPTLPQADSDDDDDSGDSE